VPVKVRSRQQRETVRGSLLLLTDFSFFLNPFMAFSAFSVNFQWRPLYYKRSCEEDKTMMNNTYAALEMTMTEGTGLSRSRSMYGQLESPTLDELLQFAEPRVMRWVRYWGYRTLNTEDIEDIWAEVRIAILHFKLPEDACEWQPLLVGFLKRVSWRIYRRYTDRNPVHAPLDALPEDVHCDTDEVSLDSNSDLARQVAQQLLQMPVLQAAAMLFHFDTDLTTAILFEGGASLELHLQLPAEALSRLIRQSPCPDSMLAEAYNTTGRTLIAARQNARKRLQKTIQI
jgi:hypothetical protein